MSEALIAEILEDARALAAKANIDPERIFRALADEGTELDEAIGQEIKLRNIRALEGGWIDTTGEE